MWMPRVAAVLAGLCLNAGAAVVTTLDGKQYDGEAFLEPGNIVSVVLGDSSKRSIPIDQVKTLYGTTPLYGNNARLHLGSAAIALIFAIWPGYQLTQVGVKEEINPHVPHKS